MLLNTSSNGFSPPSRDGMAAIVLKINQLDQKMTTVRNELADSLRNQQAQMDDQQAQIDVLKARLDGAAIP